MSKKEKDVATLGSLCVDIVLSVPELPPSSPQLRKAYLHQLLKTPPPKQYWEAGGISNTAIAAARLGLHCIIIGQVGDEIYGHFLSDVLREEKVDMAAMIEHDHIISSSSTSYQTQLCCVLVNPLQEHDFCSPADFVNDPALSWMIELSTEVKMAIRQSKILFCDSYAFMVLPPDTIVSALDYATEVGRSIFFDPGPRGKLLANGTLAEQKALDKLLTMSCVILLTSDEAELLTGIRDPILAGMEFLRKGICTEWVIVKMGSILITKTSISFAPAFKLWCRYSIWLHTQLAIATYIDTCKCSGRCNCNEFWCWQGCGNTGKSRRAHDKSTTE